MLALVAGLAAALTLGPAQATGTQTRRLQVIPKNRKFSITMRYSFNPIPKRLRSMDFWFPIPLQDEHQKIHNLFLEVPYASETAVAPDTGNRVLHVHSGPRGGLPMQVRISFDAERIEDLRNGFEATDERPAAQEEEHLRERWLRSGKLFPMDRDIKTRASRIVSGKKDPLARARAIYDFVVEKITLLEDPKQLRGAGYGNAAFTLEQMKGDHTDLAAAFVGLCRATGIPARTVMGLKIPRGADSGKLTSYHSWAEFRLRGTGWVPVDPAEARRHPSRRAYYFGALDEDRLAISVGRDIVLIPAQAGPPLNYFINAYWEGDRREMPTPWVEVTFRELAEIPDRALRLTRPPATQPAPPAGRPPR